MIKEVTLICNEEQTLEIDGESVVQTVEAARVVKVIPEGGETFDEFIRLHQHEPLENFLWNAPVDDWDTQVSCDPDEEPRWELEE